MSEENTMDADESFVLRDREGERQERRHIRHERTRRLAMFFWTIAFLGFVGLVAQCDIHKHDLAAEEHRHAPDLRDLEEAKQRRLAEEVRLEEARRQTRVDLLRAKGQIDLQRAEIEADRIAEEEKARLDHQIRLYDREVAYKNGRMAEFLDCADRLGHDECRRRLYPDEYLVDQRIQAAPKIYQACLSALGSPGCDDQVERVLSATDRGLSPSLQEVPAP